MRTWDDRLVLLVIMEVIGIFLGGWGGALTMFVFWIWLVIASNSNTWRRR